MIFIIFYIALDAPKTMHFTVTLEHGRTNSIRRQNESLKRSRKDSSKEFVFCDAVHINWLLFVIILLNTFQ